MKGLTHNRVLIVASNSFENGSPRHASSQQKINFFLNQMQFVLKAQRGKEPKVNVGKEENKPVPKDLN